MTKYLISFADGAMTFPLEDLPAVSDASHDVVREIKAIGAWVFGGGVNYEVDASVVNTDGTTTHGPYPEGAGRLGGMTVIEVPSREEALEWAAKIAVACRCAQEVREFMYDPES